MSLRFVLEKDPLSSERLKCKVMVKLYGFVWSSWMESFGEGGGGAFGFMLHLSRIDKIVTVVILLVFSVRFLIVLLLFL
jgi:hypothetical protein